MKYVYVAQPKQFLRIASSKLKPGRMIVELACMETVHSVKVASSDAIEEALDDILADVRVGPHLYDISLENAMEAIKAAMAEAEPVHGTPRSFREVVAQLQGNQSRQSFADELGTSYYQVREWSRKDTIPSQHWDKVLAVAASNNRSDITWELLTKLRANKRRKKPFQSG